MGTTARHAASCAVLGLVGAFGGWAASTAEPRRSITIAAEDDAAPWSYADGSGYANDLVRSAFGEMGWTVALKVVPYARCKALATSGEIAGCLTVSKDPRLEATLRFPAQALIRPHNILLARADSPLSGCSPGQWPRQASLGSTRSYEYVPQVDALLASGQVRHEISDSEILNLRKLQLGRIDAMVVTLDPIKTLDYLAKIAGVKGDFKTLCDYGSFDGFVAFSRLHPESAAALAIFEEGYAKLSQRGQIASMQTAWRARALEGASVKKH